MAELFKTPEISYTSRDYESIRDDLIRAIVFFVPEWTDHNESDFGIAILEMVAYVMDVLHFYIDRQMLEGFLATAIKRESVRELLKLIDYALGSASPSSVDVTFTLGSALISDLTIPELTKIQTVSDTGVEPVVFETSSEVIIPAGDLSVTVGAVEGTTKEEFLGISDGTQLQRFGVSFERIIDTSIKVFVNEGSGEEEWERVSSFIFSEGTEKHYTVDKVGSPELVVIQFGDNVQGKIPSPSAVIRVEVRVLSPIRGNVFGNVGAGTIVTLIDSITLSGNPVSLSVINDFSATGGEDEESLNEAKIKGPRSIYALNRAVTLPDYKILSEQFPGIALANAILAEKSFCCGDVCVIIYPEGGIPSSSVLKDDLIEYFYTRKMAGRCIEVKDACEKRINIEASVYLKDNFTQEDAEKCINNEINTFFDIKNGPLVIGKDINVIDIYELFSNCFDEGLRHADLNVLTTEPDPEYLSWDGDTVFDFITPKEKSLKETWTIIFTSSTTFTVRGSESGLQQNIGTLGQIYTTDDPDVLTFQIIPDPNISPAQPNSIGDAAIFDTSKIIGNIDIAEDCLAVKGNISLTFVGGNKKQIKC